MPLHTITDLEYQRFKNFLEKACGILLGEGKAYLIASRLNRMAKEEGFKNLGELVSELEKISSTALRNKVVDAMTTNETSWFRDKQPFEALAKIVLPEFEEKKKAGLKIWSAACSSGQEPYTISMVLSEYAKANSLSKVSNSRITATDISSDILNEAKAAEYDDLALARGLSEQRKHEFFTKHDERWQVSREIKQRVSFRQQNLLEGFSLLGRFDIIFCRNVLIYFSAEIKQDILKRMAQSLNPGGYLFLGASETISGYSDLFELVRTPYANIYRRID